MISSKTSRGYTSLLVALALILASASLTLANDAPVASDDTVATDKNMALPITLVASDTDEDPLDYSVVTDPSNGTLSGTAPNLTYTPNPGFNGNDSFTFKANDGTDDSNTATISITVYGVRTLDYTAATPGTVQTFKIALIMINTLTTPIADNPVSKQLEFYSPETLGQIFFEHEHGANAFIQEASYGKIALEGRVVGWLDHPQAGLNGTDISSDASTYLSLANNYLTYSDYDIFVVHSLVEGGGQQTGWLYPQQSFNTPQGNIQNIGITWMANSQVFDFAPLLTSYWSSGDSVLPTTSWSHELLHTFGISGHANSYDCGVTTLATDGPDSPIKGYGDSFSIMGEYAYATHPNALMKSRIGWLDPTQLPEITTTGTYDIHPMTVNDGQAKALVIPVDPPITHTQNASEFDAIIVEYRTALGFDRYLERLDGSTFLSRYTTLEDIDYSGVLVYMRYASTTTDATVLLDMNPDTTFDPGRGIKWPGNAGKFADAILPIDSTFICNNIQITPVGTTESGAMSINVTFTPTIYENWSQQPFANPFTEVAITVDADHDRSTNVMEFAFGTDPTTAYGGSLTADGTINGNPLAVLAPAGTSGELYFVRRQDHSTPGSAIYLPQFSGDLETFHDSTESPTPIINSTDDPAYEIVKVPYPETLPDGKKATFGRVQVIYEP